MHGDEQVCLDAGMDAFLAKPHSAAALRTVLSRWLASSDHAVPPSSGPVSQAPAINMTTLNGLQSLDEVGGSLVDDLVTLFLRSADEELEQVARAVADRDATSLAQRAHSMKSSAAHLGAEALAACYRELEKCGREGRVDDAGTLLAKTRPEHRRAVAHLRDLLSRAA